MIGGIILGFVIANMVLSAVTVIAVYWGLSEHQRHMRVDSRLRALEERSGSAEVEHG
jgi:hypothetical protein